MKKYVIIIVVIVLLICLIKPKQEEIRVRVIPKDNTVESLDTKKDVILIVRSFLDKIDLEDKNYSKQCASIKNNLGNLEDCLDEYNCNVEFKKYNFPLKTYNGNVVDKTTCQTLLITIEDGQGDNWWATLYPDLFDIDSEENIEYKSFIWEEFISK